MKPRLLGLSLLAFSAASLGAAPINYHEHLGLQMWSLRETSKTDTAAALALAAKSGVKEIETAGLGTLTLDQYLAAVKDRGLTVVATHNGYEELGKDLPGVIAAAKALGARYIVCPWIPHPKEGFTVAQARQVAADFNTWGAAIRAAGLQFGWHPHGFEFQPDASGVTPFSVVVSETAPANLVLEMDVFWVYHAGVDPVKLLKQYPDRWRLMHVKDIRIGAEVGSHSGGAAATDNVPVGQGQIDWTAVLATAQAIGVEHYILEDETTDALANIPQSLGYLRGLKLPGCCPMGGCAK